MQGRIKGVSDWHHLGIRRGKRIRRNSEGGDHDADYFLLYGCLCYIDQEGYDVVFPGCEKGSC
jgi:hypothetical protein